MHESARVYVSTLLPILAMAFCHGCGGGGSSGAASQSPGSASPPAPVANVNHAPTISGAAAAIAPVGIAYEFQPVASDADGDPLTFSAENLPPWASIDPSTGKVSGTPDTSDVGEFEAITITVADAAHQAVTTPFSITVLDGGTGLASLEWETPPSKVDGSPLDDLGGYRIIYGRSADDLDRSVLINSPSVNTYEFRSLPSGIWYFAVIAVNASGLEGPPSTAAMKSI